MSSDPNVRRLLWPRSVMIGACVVAFTAVSCSRKDNEFTTVAGVQVFPRDASRRFSLEGVNVYGTLSPGDRSSIEVALGRLVKSDMSTRGLWIEWPEMPVTAKLEFADGIRVYLIKDKSGEWELAKMAADMHVHRDSFGSSDSESHTREPNVGR